MAEADLPTLALTVRQPWTWSILFLEKDIENRSWPTKVRGRVFLHAAKGMTSDEWTDGFQTAREACHPKFKGSTFPALEKGIRDLAWVVVRWAEQVWPRVILLENVEEFQTWGPLTDERQPCPKRKGETFRRWIGELERLGYVVEWRELRACDYGAPTIRKRLFLVARRDGRPIVWPEPTHGDPKSEAVRAGRLAPWRTAAEIVDWSIPAPSIFLTREEGRAIGVNRPLAEATMARIAKGVERYVLKAAKPFVVGVGGRMGQSSARPVDRPMQTVTAKADSCLAVPFLSPITHSGAPRVNDIGEPVRTLTTAHRGEQALITPVVVNTANGRTTGRGPNVWAPEEPLRTVTSGSGFAVAAPFMVPRYGERDGQEPRSRSVEEPMATIVPTGNEGSRVAPFLVPRYLAKPGDAPRTRSVEVPAATIVAGGNAPGHLVAAHIQRQFGASVGSGGDEPLGTVTAGGGGKSAVVAAFLAQHNVGVVGHDMREPVSTLTAKGCQQAVVEVSAGLVDLHGSDRRGRDVEAPLPTVTAEGNHHVEVRAFLTKYFGSAEHGQAVSDPLHTVTAKPRFGLVTVEGAEYEIVDIGMRMLTPRELYRAQGFPETYEIERGHDGRALTKTAQVRMCGNSVSPMVARALVAANYLPDQPALSRCRVRTRKMKKPGAWSAGPLFTQAGVRP